MKKVLIITYYWPPSGGIAVLRCLKFAKYLRSFGWEPIIYTANNAQYPYIDNSNNSDIPDGVEVLRGKIWEPYHVYKFITGQKSSANINNVFYTKDKQLGRAHKFSVWVRSNLFIPDARALWIKPSVKFLCRYLTDNPVDAIFSNGPPHSNTRIANLVSKNMKLPWLADFQDPWTQVDYFKQLILSKWGLNKHKRLEQDVFRDAHKITIVSPTWKNELENIGAKNVSVIPWGYDPEDYQDLHAEESTKFSIVHIGIMGYDRNPVTLFKVLNDLSSEIIGFRNNLEIKLVGQVDYSVQQAYAITNLEESVSFVENVERNIALKIAASSSLLLLPLNRQANAKGRIPGKFFEYLAVKRPILVLGPLNSDVAKITRETTRGYISEYDNYENIYHIIKEYYQQYLEGSLNKKLTGSIDKYSSYNLTSKLAGYLDSISI